MSAGAGPNPPRVWRWYLAYCGLMAAVYVGCSIAGVLVLAGIVEVDPEELAEARVGGALFAVLGVVLGAAFVAAFFLPRSPAAWTYHLVLICLGMTSACCLPATIPLLVLWIKPETRASFGREVARAGA